MVAAPFEIKANSMEAFRSWLVSYWKQIVDFSDSARPPATSSYGLTPTRTQELFNGRFELLFNPLESVVEYVREHAWTLQIRQVLADFLSKAPELSSLLNVQWKHLELDPWFANALLILSCIITYLWIRQFWTRSLIKLRHHYAPSKVYRKGPDGQPEGIRIHELIKTECSKLMTNPFSPTPWMTNGHMQTIYAALTASHYKSKVCYERVILTAEDGGKISVDWEGSEPGSPLNRPTLLILHGLTGGSHESYVQDLILALRPHGFQCVVFNFRGCSGSEIVTPQLYSASYTQDLALVVSHIRTKTGRNSMLLGAGYSLGANILLKFAGETAEDCPFDGLLSIANPFDLTATNAELHSGFWKRTIYSARLASNLIRVLKKHLHIFESSPLYDFHKVLKAKTIMDFDEEFTRKTFQFESVHEYYYHGSCYHYLPTIKRPTLCLNALDDPIVPDHVIPYSQLSSNPWIVLATTPRGGHLGWYSNWLIPKRWYAEPVSEFFIALVKVGVLF